MSSFVILIYGTCIYQYIRDLYCHATELSHDHVCLAKERMVSPWVSDHYTFYRYVCRERVDSIELHGVGSIVRQSYRQHEYDVCGISKFYATLFNKLTEEALIYILYKIDITT